MAAAMTGGQALAQQLAKEGIDHVFGIPGVQLDWALDGLIEVADRIAYTTPRHEQAAAYMADGYARTTGKVGTCMVVPGPGLLNAMAGLCTAYACSSPVLAIAGQIPSRAIGRGWGMLHEIKNQSGVLSSVTKWNALARTAAEIPGLVHEAVRQLRTGHTQPVGLEVPLDVLQQKAPVTLIEPAAPPAPAAPEARALTQAAAVLGSARFPVLYVGGGIVASGASEALRSVAERLQAPVVMSENGRGALSDRHRLALTSLGGRAVLPHADVIFVIGSRYIEGFGTPAYARPGVRYVYLNVDAADTKEPREPGLALIGDARAGLEALAAELEGLPKRASRSVAMARVRRWCDEQIAFVQPQLGFVTALRAAIPEEGILVNELTQVGYLATIAFPVYAPRTLVWAGYQGTLGYGFPTALGASIGNPARTVVSINGDGGFGWNLQELATAAKYRANLIAVVFVDGALGNVRRIQKGLFGRGIGTDLHNPDFLKLAESFGVPAERVRTPQALEGAIRAAAGRRGPAFIEVPVAEMPSPWHLIRANRPAPRPAPPNPLGEPAVL